MLLEASISKRNSHGTTAKSGAFLNADWISLTCTVWYMKIRIVASNDCHSRADRVSCPTVGGTHLEIKLAPDPDTVERLPPFRPRWMFLSVKSARLNANEP